MLPDGAQERIQDSCGGLVGLEEVCIRAVVVVLVAAGVMLLGPGSATGFWRWRRWRRWWWR